MVTKEDGDGQRRRKRTPPDNDGSTLAAAGEELPARWSVQRKTDLVPRLLRGEGLESDWPNVFSALPVAKDVFEKRPT
jgi:hypothetical protein